MPRLLVVILTSCALGVLAAYETVKKIISFESGAADETDDAATSSSDEEGGAKGLDGTDRMS
jgi:hypothetical protein